jgi:putative DNA methylase
MKNPTPNIRSIETDGFPFEFLSQIAERESWRKEIHRPIYYVHKWWAKRLGSVFRGILLGSALDEKADIPGAFYRCHDFSDVRVFDPFMGSGTTVGETHKLGFTALGRDINPVAVEAVKTALGPMDLQRIAQAYKAISEEMGGKVQALYRSKDSSKQPCDVLYYFWVMQAPCPDCARRVDLFSSYVFAQNAYPKRKPEVQIVCPGCGEIFQGLHEQKESTCPQCRLCFNPQLGLARGQTALCVQCDHKPFSIAQAIASQGRRPDYRLYAKLVLRKDGSKEYLRATDEDVAAEREASRQLRSEIEQSAIQLPDLALEPGYNTNQALSYEFRNWRDFFNDRQLLALGWLRAAINKLEDSDTRAVMMTLFSGLLEFNNLFTSYKGEGTGAVRHMFSHHILKPERVPIEANVWGTPKSSGSFSGLYKGRLLRALAYRQNPTEVNGIHTEKGRICSPPFTGEVHPWPKDNTLSARGIYLSCGDSAVTGLADKSIDLVVTDPPFFDNVHYSQLADFFYAWQQIGSEGDSTRHDAEVQDTDAASFATKLQKVFSECRRVLKDDGLLVFTYHHSREEGWHAVAEAIHEAGFVVVNSQPIKSEMSVAAPKAAAKEPIQLDIVLVCRKAWPERLRHSVAEALQSAYAKLARLAGVDFELSRNDRKIVLFGQLLTTLKSPEEAEQLSKIVEDELTKLDAEIEFSGDDAGSANQRALPALAGLKSRGVTTT